jgi:choline dehydrogenase
MFDYIIVGAGSAGCVLAARLAEDPKTRVLLLEAGGSDTAQNIRIPAAFSKLFKSEYDWAFYTESQPQLFNRRLYWPRGKGLGGSSSINAMIYVRGHRNDYDEWAATGNAGWGFADALPRFKKSEHNERGASEFHATGGPLNVADQHSLHRLSRVFLKACGDASIRSNSDFNGAEQEGAGFFQVTQKNGRRWSAADAFLRPALARPNLTVLTGAHASRILFNGRRATGVAYLRNGSAMEEQAAREIILCGGAVQSPQLLLLSGIGPADYLKQQGIPQLIELTGVGENLQDHIAVPIVFRCTRRTGLHRSETLFNLLRWRIFGGGPLTSIVAEAGAFVKTRPDLAQPDIQLLFAPAFYIDHGFTQPAGDGFSIGVTLLRPRSRGNVRLCSTDAQEGPMIRANYLSDHADVAPLVAGIKLARRIAHSKAFDPFRGEEMMPGPKVQSDDEIAIAARKTAETLYHPVGTCRMGNDDRAVVDERLRVRGLEGLRVADASVMPAIVGGNTNAPTMMIAEKAAEMIREDSLS